MNPNLIFAVANPIALVGWIVLALFPHRRRVIDGLCGTAIPAAFATTYAVIVAVTWAGADGSFSSLSGVAALFNDPWILLAGWLHYLTFDLLIGVWETRDAATHGVPRLVLLPCLALTFLFGPAGWLLYVTIRRRYSASMPTAAQTF